MPDIKLNNNLFSAFLLLYHPIKKVNFPPATHKPSYNHPYFCL
jgi:hypothetical protein